MDDTPKYVICALYRGDDADGTLLTEIVIRILTSVFDRLAFFTFPYEPAFIDQKEMKIQTNATKKEMEKVCKIMNVLREFKFISFDFIGVIKI